MSMDGVKDDGSSPVCLREGAGQVTHRATLLDKGKAAQLTASQALEGKSTGSFCPRLTSPSSALLHGLSVSQHAAAPMQI